VSPAFHLSIFPIGDHGFVRDAADWNGRRPGSGKFRRIFSGTPGAGAQSAMASRPRILIASPHADEATLLADWVASEGFEPVRLSTLPRAAEEIKERPFDLFMADFLFAFRSEQQLVPLVRARNARTPILVVGDQDAAGEAQALARGAMYLARPLERTSVVCTVSMAVMEARPTRRSLRKTVNRFDAVVDGIPSHIIDVSMEGLRLEIPRRRKSAPPPPHFTVRVPILGVALAVRRMWTCSVPQSDRDAAWYGGELSGNSRVVEQAWQGLVDAMPTPGAALELH
jgi:AmiR/NasT family two-component response regulator